MMTWYVTTSTAVYIVTAENVEMARILLARDRNVYVENKDLINVVTSSRWSKGITPAITYNLLNHPDIRP